MSASAEQKQPHRKLFGVVPFPSIIGTLLSILASLATVAYAMKEAYRIRTYALTEYGYVIHEFDPWFNYRATEYLARHGWHAFFHWFDYMSWYPIGRPVGTTIYPGLQITSVAIYRVLKWLGKPYRMTLNDICCTVPCWGGAAATVFLALLTYEATNSRTMAAIAAVVMAIIPAHIMRSVGGGYDNESIAMTAMLMTFFFWVRSLRTPSSWPIGIIAGLAYGYMVAAWGGYIFVLNMVALHAGFSLVHDTIKNRYDPGLYKAYTLFYIVGTAIATTVPPVGMTPFKSLEQMLALLVFIFFHAVHASEILRKKEKVEVASRRGLMIRAQFMFGTISGLILVTVCVVPSGFFGPLSSRVRGLFVTHTRTGNPLVDSVAEHQPASASAYWQYLHYCYYFWNISVFVFPLMRERRRAAQFLFLYGVVAYYFSLKMARLIILSGPVASAGAGLCIGFLVQFFIDQFIWSKADEAEEANAAVGKDKNGKLLLRKGAWEESFEGTMTKARLQFKANRQKRQVAAVAIFAILLVSRIPKDFLEHSERLAHSFSNPQLMFKSRMHDGSIVMIDDYREAYHWLRDKTPQDSRVMAWWDYGYQITGIGNRTSIADGNTWNHEHIATLGKCLTSPVKEAHSLIRHLADYVLVWAGGRSDDLAKSPHMARIGNSVYHDICPKTDPQCSHFGFKDRFYKNPTPSMAKSLLYHLSVAGLPGQSKVTIDKNLFTFAFQSRHGYVRIFKVMNVSQESKDWLADPKNRVCDAPGSWYCVGQYPPAKEIQDLLKRKTDFAQLEDFNRRRRGNK